MSPAIAVADQLDAGPMRAWLLEQVADLDAEHERALSSSAMGASAAIGGVSPRVRLCRRLGWEGSDSDLRRLHRWLNENPILAAGEVLEVLLHVGREPGELYPELALDEQPAAGPLPAYRPRPDLDAAERCECGRCKSATARRCEHCSWVTRRERKQAGITRADLSVCPGCGEAKVPEAARCWECYKAAGANRGTRHRNRGPQKVTTAQLEQAYALYALGFSLRAVAAQVHPDSGYASMKACANGLARLFKARGWPTRTIREANQARTIHGLQSDEVNDPAAAKRHRRRERGLRPLCAGVKSTYPQKGRPCGSRAANGSDYCPSHDPEHAAARDEHLHAARARVGMPLSLPPSGGSVHGISATMQ